MSSGLADHKPVRGRKRETPEVARKIKRGNKGDGGGVKSQQNKLAGQKGEKDCRAWEGVSVTN